MRKIGELRYKEKCGQVGAGRGLSIKEIKKKCTYSPKVMPHINFLRKLQQTQVVQ